MMHSHRRKKSKEALNEHEKPKEVNDLIKEYVGLKKVGENEKRQDEIIKKLKKFKISPKEIRKFTEEEICY